MEAAGIVKIFQRSKSERGICYRQYLGHSGSKAFITIKALSPYGEQCKIKKLDYWVMSRID